MPNTVIEAQEATVAAEQAVTAAYEKIATLEQKVIDGDGKVTAAQITTAKEQAAFAELKASAAQNEEARIREGSRQAAVDAYLAEYEKFATVDITPLRERYNEIVVLIAELDALVEERIAAQREILVKGSGLGLSDGYNGVPVKADVERWRAIEITRDVLDGLATEGRHGYVMGVMGPGIHHALHTPERKADMAKIRASGWKQGTARELLDAFVEAHSE